MYIIYQYIVQYILLFFTRLCWGQTIHLRSGSPLRSGHDEEFKLHHSAKPSNMFRRIWCGSAVAQSPHRVLCKDRSLFWYFGPMLLNAFGFKYRHILFIMQPHRGRCVLEPMTEFEGSLFIDIHWWEALTVRYSLSWICTSSQCSWPNPCRSPQCVCLCGTSEQM